MYNGRGRILESKTTTKTIIHHPDHEAVEPRAVINPISKNQPDSKFKPYQLKNLYIDLSIKHHFKELIAYRQHVVAKSKRNIYFSALQHQASILLLRFPFDTSTGRYQRNNGHHLCYVDSVLTVIINYSGYKCIAIHTLASI